MAVVGVLMNKDDLRNLGAYLEQNVQGFSGLKHVEKFAVGQSNPTFCLDTGDEKFVLRCKPKGKLVQSAHAIDREYRVLSALADTDVTIAKTILYCEDSDVLGTEFYLMEFVQGEIFSDPALPNLDNHQRTDIYQAQCSALAAIHSVDLRATNLTDYGRPGSYFERQYERWSQQYRSKKIERVEAMDQLISWLGRNMPSDDGRATLVHGDYRLDNLMISTADWSIAAVVDWELSTIGHPYADLAYQCMQWRLPNNPIAKGLGAIDRNKVGIPTERQYIAEYCKLAGNVPIANWSFYLAFSFFRLAAILHGILERSAGGNASNPQAVAVGDMYRNVAKMGLDVVHNGY